LNNLKSLVDSQAILEKQRLDLETKEIDLDKKEQEFQFIVEKGQDVKGQIENIDRQIAEQVKHQQGYASKIEELSQCTDSTICPLCSGPIVDRQAVIKHYQDMITQAKSEAINLEIEQHKLEEQRNSLRQKYSELNNELGQRKDLDKQIGQFKEKLRAIKEASETKEKLAQDVEQLQAQKERDDYATVQRVSLINLTSELNDLQFDPALYANIQAQIRSQRGIESRYYQLQRDLTELSKIESVLPELSNKIDTLKVIIAEESYGDIVRDSMRLLDQQLQEINYDQNSHNELKEKLKALMPKVEKYKDIKRAMSELPVLEKNLNDAQSWLSDKSEQKIRLAHEYENAVVGSDQLSQIEMEISQLEKTVMESRHHYELFVQEQAKLNANLERSEAEIANMQKQKEELSSARLALDDFSYLAECFGKKGIQAIIIENAIPEIEIDANRILGRLTDNKMHVALITQQKNKSGSITETLDIVVGDDIGTRSYELYSGGEAFKVNFAIRVALSRLLARRAGAKLETLIIDEGFGSQDDHSRDKLVKAIRSIQSDFARILVITHFADVKEMFPAHILINKSGGSSQIELIN